MVMLSQQTILCRSKMPIRILNLKNPHNINQTMVKLGMVCPPDLHPLHARTQTSSNKPNPSNTRDPSSQVMFHSLKSAPRSSSQELLQIHFLENLKLRLESYCPANLTSCNILPPSRRRKPQPTNSITLRNLPRKSPWIFHLSCHHFQRI